MFRIRQVRRWPSRRFAVVLAPPDADEAWLPARPVGRLRLAWRLHREGFDRSDVATVLDHVRASPAAWLEIQAGRTPRTGPRHERRVQPSEHAQLRDARVLLWQEGGQLAGDLHLRITTPPGQDETLSLGPRALGPLAEFAGADLGSLEFHVQSLFDEHVHDLWQDRYLLVDRDLDELAVDYDVSPEVAGVLDDTTPPVRPWVGESDRPRSARPPLRISWLDE